MTAESLFNTHKKQGLEQSFPVPTLGSSANIATIWDVLNISLRYARAFGLSLLPSLLVG